MATKRTGSKSGRKLSPLKNEAQPDHGTPLTDEALEDEARPGTPLDGPESGFKWKDLRLMRATQKAVVEMKRIKPPRTEKELRAEMKKVATAVAHALQTAPAVALSAYIDPRVWKKWRSAKRPSGKSSTWPAVAAKAKEIEELLAERFRARWKAVEADFANGIDVAKARARFFLASGNLELRTARRYYNPARATKFANSSTAEIVELCWGWWFPFQVFAYNSGDELVEIGDQLEELVSSEYVAMTWGLFDTRPGYEESTEEVEDFYYCDSPHGVYPLPNLTTRYGDVYEAIVYSYMGERLRVCKSIADPFLEAERIDAMDEIERSFLRNACEEGDDPRTWRVNFRRLTSLLLPKYGRALIEADILGDAGSPEQKHCFQMVKEGLKAQGNGYLKRPRARIRR